MSSNLLTSLAPKWLDLTLLQSILLSCCHSIRPSNGLSVIDQTLFFHSMQTFECHLHTRPGSLLSEFVKSQSQGSIYFFDVCNIYQRVEWFLIKKKQTNKFLVSAEAGLGLGPRNETTISKIDPDLKLANFMRCSMHGFQLTASQRQIISSVVVLWANAEHWKHFICCK